MTIRCFAALSAALFVGGVQAGAQDRAPAPTIPMVRERVQAGQLNEAWALVQQIPESAEVLREGIGIAVRRTDAWSAMQWYERLARREPTGDRDLLTRIGLLRARQLETDSDSRVVVEACRAEVASAGKPPCVAEMRRIADDGSADMGSRLAAAVVLIEAGLPGTDTMLQTLVGIATENNPSAAADALSQYRATSSMRSLMHLAGGSHREAKYIATLALVRLKSTETLPVLRTVATDPEGGAARLIAYIGLAGFGDADALKIVNETLPLMKGRDLLEAGRAFVRLKDPRGASILRSMAEGDHELLRIEAAEALHEIDPAQAATFIRAASGSANPWVRASAFAAAARLRIAPTPSMRMAMLDSNSWVAIRAVQAVAADAASLPKASR